MKYFLITLLACTALFFACRKNMDETTDREIGPIQPKNVEAALVGRVVDANGAIVPNASIVVEGNTWYADGEGMFYVPKRLLDSNGAYIRVSKPGYFLASRFAMPHLNSTTFIEIQLIPKNLLASFSAADGATIDLGNGAKVVIPANAVAYNGGNVPLGIVRAYAVWLDPSSAETFRAMPGDLRGIDARGDAKILRTFGMIGVELEDASGSPINLKDGQKAKISFPVPSSMQAGAPGTIPLWHLNMYTGYWEEEGAAELLNGRYEGEVSHFSFWNVDQPNTYAKLTLCLANPDGEAIGGLEVNIQSANFGTGSGYSDDLGQVSGFVPVNETLHLTVKDRCGVTVREEDIDPLTEDTNLGKITIAGLNTITVSGILQNCDQEAITNGIATIIGNAQNSFYAATNSAGEFSFTFVDCFAGNDAKVFGFNFDENTSSEQQTVTLNSGGINLGVLSVCTPSDEYITFSCEGYTKTFFFYTHFDANSPTSGFIFGGGPGLPGGLDSVKAGLQILDYNAALGTATLGSIYARFIANGSILDYGCNYCSDNCSCSPMDTNPIVFTSYPGSVGDYAVGTVTGNLLSGQDKLMKPFSIAFRVKRVI